MAAPPTSSPPGDRLRYLWLGLGAAAALLAVGGRWDLPLAAWVFPILLLRFARTSRPAGLLWVLLVSVAAALFWMVQSAVPLTPLVLVGIAGFGVAFALPFLADRLAAPRTATLGRVLLLPAAMMSVEFLLGTFGPFGTAYGLRAATQTAETDLLQVTALTGPYAISFLIGALATVANLVWERGLTRTAVRAAVGYAAVLALIAVSGQIRLATVPVGAETVRIAGINPSQAAMDAETAIHGASRLDVTDPRRVDQAKVAAASGPVLDDLFAQTRQAARGGAKIVGWSENAARVLGADHGAFLERASRVADDEDIYLNVADLVYLPDSPHARDETHMFGPDGERLWDYQKAKPIPGLEIYRPGDGDIPVIDTPYGRISNVICYDADFPAINRIDADIVLVPGGDWPEMGRIHTRMAGLRAIENGYSLVRQDFNGESTAYDSYGRVLSTQDTTNGSGIWYAEVPTAGTGSGYQVTGDLLSWAALAGTAAIIGTAIARPRRPGHPSGRPA